MTTTETTTLSERATGVLTTAEARAKAAVALAAAAAWEDGNIRDVGATAPPDRPSRPEHPVLQSPGKMPRRRIGTVEGRIALLHAVAHIELNAIDLAWDIIARFPDMPRAFYDEKEKRKTGRKNKMEKKTKQKKKKKKKKKSPLL